MRKSKLVTLAAISLAAASLVAAGSASAASIAVEKPCYVNEDISQGEPITVTGSGFPVGDEIELTGEGVFGTATASATGTISAVVTGPILPTIYPAVSAFTLTASDETTEGVTATIPLDVANLAVQTTPALAKPSKRVQYSFSGFIGGPDVYGHYVHDGRLVASKRFGAVTGSCGQLKTKSLNFPTAKPRYAKYMVQFDNSPKYSPATKPKLTTTLTIERVFK